MVADLQAPRARPGLPDALLRPEAWAEPRPDNVELIETHISWVFRGPREVLKVKKPVSFGFLDFSTPKRRREACDAEVRLNARLAPGTYLGVVPIVERDGRLGVGGKGRVEDWAVRMERLDDARRADALLARGELSAARVDELAEVIARFHASVQVDPVESARWGSWPAIERNVCENFDQTRADISAFIDTRMAAEAESRQRAFVRDHQPLLSARVAEGRVRDGHGDLRLEHVYFEEGATRVIDCIEFDPRYRIADVCADIAFLAMDLEAHGRVDLAERLLARYARASEDYDIYALVDFYAGYRAWIRGKVTMLLAHDKSVTPRLRRQAQNDARRHFLLAVASCKTSLVAPTLVCVGGLIASGKSTVSDAIAGELSCPVVGTDRTRKHMLGVGEERPLHDLVWRGAYEPNVTQRVYSEVLRRASVVLASGRSVVVDASFRSRGMRASARDLAQQLGIAFRFVECRAPLDTCRSRLAARHSGPSDGRLAIFNDFAASFEPVDELPSSEHVVLDTTQSSEQVLANLRAQVTTWPRGLDA